MVNGTQERFVRQGASRFLSTVLGAEDCHIVLTRASVQTVWDQTRDAATMMLRFQDADLVARYKGLNDRRFPYPTEDSRVWARLVVEHITVPAATSPAP